MGIRIMNYLDDLARVSLNLVIKFLRGAQRSNPPHPHIVPTWDLSTDSSARTQILLLLRLIYDLYMCVCFRFCLK